MMVDFLCNHIDDPVAVRDILWSNGLSSEFKNKFKVKVLQSLSLTHKKAFLIEIFAANHGKGVADEIGGKAKSLLCVKVTSKGDDSIIVQSSNDFSKAAKQLLNKQKRLISYREKFPQEYQKLLTEA